MEFLTEKHDFDNAFELAKRDIDFTKAFPQQLFLKNQKYFSFITFDDIHSTDFFNFLCSFCKSISENSFMYMVTDPGPEYYFYKSKIKNPKVEKYKALICSVNDDEKMFLNALNAHSGGTPPDSMMDVSDIIVVSSINQKWHIVADREAGISVCAIYDLESYNKFIDCFGKFLLGDVQIAAEFAYGKTRWGENQILKK